MTIIDVNQKQMLLGLNEKKREEEETRRKCECVLEVMMWERRTGETLQFLNHPVIKDVETERNQLQHVVSVVSVVF